MLQQSDHNSKKSRHPCYSVHDTHVNLCLFATFLSSSAFRFDLIVPFFFVCNCWVSGGFQAFFIVSLMWVAPFFFDFWSQFFDIL